MDLKKPSRGVRSGNPVRKSGRWKTIDEFSTADARIPLNMPCKRAMSHRLSGAPHARHGQGVLSHRELGGWEWTASIISSFQFLYYLTRYRIRFLQVRLLKAAVLRGLTTPEYHQLRLCRHDRADRV